MVVCCFGLDRREELKRGREEGRGMGRALEVWVVDDTEAMLLFWDMSMKIPWRASIEEKKNGRKTTANRSLALSARICIFRRCNQETKNIETRVSLM